MDSLCCAADATAHGLVIDAANVAGGASSLHGPSQGTSLIVSITRIIQLYCCCNEGMGFSAALVFWDFTHPVA